MVVAATCAGAGHWAVPGNQHPEPAVGSPSTRQDVVPLKPRGRATGPPPSMGWGRPVHLAEATAMTSSILIALSIGSALVFSALLVVALVEVLDAHRWR